MKMIKNIFRLALAVLSLGAVAAGCSVKEDPVAGQPREIRFGARMGTFEVKATDKGFERGDAIGLFAYQSSSSEQNIRMTWDGLSLLPEKALYWGMDSDWGEFYAYYPYNPDVQSTNFEFSVNADQSTRELFEASDLLTAYLYASANETDHIVFNFHHLFSQLIIRVDSSLEGLQIADIYLGNVYGRSYVNLYGDGSVSVTGELGTIKACPVTLADKSSAWAVIVPPQWASPRLYVTTTDGKQYTYESDDNIDFRSGYRQTATITIGEYSMSTDFSQEVAEWTDNNDLQFSIVWSMIGSLQGSDWKVDFDMKREDDNRYTYEFEYKTGQEFKFRKNHKWDENYGFGDGVSNMAYPGHINLQWDGANIMLPNSGIWRVTFYPNWREAHFELLKEYEDVDMDLTFADNETCVYKGPYQIAEGWSSSLADLSWGGYDWSWVKAGDMVIVYQTFGKGESPVMRISDGYWNFLPSLDGDIYLEYGAIGAQYLCLTQEDVDKLQESGLVLYGTNYWIRAVTVIPAE